MKRRLRILALVLGVTVAAGAVAVLVAGSAAGDQTGSLNNVIARQVAIEHGDLIPTKFDKPMSSGVLTAVEAATSQGGSDAALRFLKAAAVPVPPSSGSLGCPHRFDPGEGGVANIRVNQDCSLRRQAEEVVAVNPRNPDNIIAGQNDSVIGFNHCGYDWSLDGGQTWGSVGTAPPPFWQEILRDGHTSDACSDPTATFDSQGNAYVSGVFFDITSPANGIFVAKSNYPIQGRFYHSPFPLSFQEYRATPMGRPASDIDPNIAHDKEFMIADTRSTSRKRDRVYLTWTRFESNKTPPGGRSPIVFSQSTDGGATWSKQVIISGASGSFCTVDSGTPDNPNACDQDQGSDPVVGPDGTIYVIFGNGNTPGLGQNQVLMVKCPATNNCDKETDWSAPVRIGGLIGTHPIGDPGNAGGCPTRRRCLPPNGYRVPEFTSMTISVDRDSNLYATWADFRNGKAPCTPNSLWSVAKPPCNNDVFYAFSTNGGATWSPTVNVTASLGETAQFQPWSDVMGDGSSVQVAFYDRHYGDCEFTGCNDITLATIGNPRSLTPSIRFRRITTSSMPNLTPATNPLQAGFIGDYMWVEVSRHNFDQRSTHIVWADTRPLFGSAPEEDLYYARVGAGDGDDNNNDDNGGGNGGKR
jgi:hypothetical protein